MGNENLSLNELVDGRNNEMINEAYKMFNKMLDDNVKILEEAKKKVRDNKNQFQDYCFNLEICSKFEIQSIGKVLAELAAVYYSRNIVFMQEENGDYIIRDLDDMSDPIILGCCHNQVYKFYTPFINETRHNGLEFSLKSSLLFDKYPILKTFGNLLIEYRMKNDLNDYRYFTEVELRLVLKEFVLKYKDEIEGKFQKKYASEEEIFREQLNVRKIKDSKNLAKLLNNYE